MSDAGFVLPRAVLGILRLNSSDYWGVCTAAAIVRSRWPMGGFDLVSRASTCRNIAVALEDLFRGYIARVVEEGRIVEDRLEVFRYLVIISTFHIKEIVSQQTYLTHLVVELNERVNGLNSQETIIHPGILRIRK